MEHLCLGFREATQVSKKIQQRKVVRVMKLSLIIPIYNEEELVDTLVERTHNALSSVIDDFEIICVNDGSTDSSLEKLLQFHHSDRRIKVLSLSRNFGHQSAYTAGLEYAKGEYVAMMDGDLQDPPELIEEMLKKAKDERFDVVYGKRKASKEKVPKLFLARAFHYIFRKVSHMSEIQNVGNFAVMNRKAVNALLCFKEKHRYLPGLRAFIGFNQGEVIYERQQRLSGEAKMTLAKLFRLGFDAVFSFTDLPIKMCLYIGLTGMFSCVIAFFYVILSKLTGIAPFGWSSTTLSIFFLGFIQLIFLGILGEYLFRVYRESQNRPLYIISEIYE
jgi:dolichol-phosphate mannosyltransferase